MVDQLMTKPYSELSVNQPKVVIMSEEMLKPSTLKILPAFLMCFFLGFLGVHRFYTGRIVTGILQILTLGGLGIWSFIDMILLATGNFKDKTGSKLTEWK